MTDILVGKVGNPHDGLFLQANLHLSAVIYANNTGLKATGLNLLDYLRFINFDFLNIIGAPNNIGVVPYIILQINILFGSFPHPENIIFLSVPYITFI